MCSPLLHSAQSYQNNKTTKYFDGQPNASMRITKRWQAKGNHFKTSSPIHLMQLLKLFPAIVAFISIASCSSVSKHDAFTTYKSNATVLKTETDRIFTEALKLDLSKGQKLAATRAASRTAAAHQRLKDTLTSSYATETRIDAISRALRKMELGQGDSSELIDKWIDARNKAQSALNEAKASPETKPDELKKFEAAFQTAEIALAEKVNELKAEQIQAIALEPKLKAAVAKAKERNDEARIESEKAVNQFVLDLRGTQKEPFRWGRSEGAIPSSLKLKYNKSKLIECFEAFEEYCDLLTKLANPQLISSEEFKNSANKLNGSANKLLNLDLNVAKGSEVALVSHTAIGIAQVYLRDRQARTLQRFLQENQTTVDRFVKLLRTALIQLRSNIDMYYKPSIDTASDDARSTAVDDAAKRAAGIASMFTINETYAELLQSIKSLSSKVDKLSVDHAKLSKSIVTPSLTADYIDSAGSQIGGLANGIQTSLSQNRYHEAQFVAEASDELAAEHERKYAVANAETLKAKAEYDIAKTAADSNPEDTAAKSVAEEMQKNYIVLKAASDQLKVQAEYYRALNAIDKTQAAKLKPSE